MSVREHCHVCGGYRVLSGREPDTCSCLVIAPQPVAPPPLGAVMLFLVLRIGFVAGLGYVACFRDWSLLWLAVFAAGVFLPTAIVSLAMDKSHQLILGVLCGIGIILLSRVVNSEWQLWIKITSGIPLGLLTLAVGLRHLSIHGD